MPIYRYRCEAGHEFEDLESITAPSERPCTHFYPDEYVECNLMAQRVPSIPAPAQFNCSMPTYRKPMR